MTRMRIEAVSINRIRERPKDKLYAARRGEDWREAIEALRANPNDPDFAYVYKPIDVVCVSKSGNRAVYPDCLFSIVDGKHRYYCLKAIGAETIKVRFTWHDVEADIALRSGRRQAYVEWKRHKCQNCKHLKTLKKGHKIKVNDFVKLCFFRCPIKGEFMNADDLMRINECKEFQEK